MSFLQGKRALIIGVLSEQSIAYGIAQAMRAQGAELAITYQKDKFLPRVTPLAQALGSNIILPCDVASDESIASMLQALEQHWTQFDILVHSVAFVPKAALAGDYLDSVSREYFQIAHDVSAYSFAALAKAALPMMQGRKASLLTVSFLGAERAMPNYNVMGLAKASLEANVRYMAQSLGPKGIRVNAVSAGPIATLAASGITGFDAILQHNAAHAPLCRNITLEEIGNAAAFLCSDLASGITGEITYVDGGMNIVG